MEYAMQRVRIPGTHVSGVDVSGIDVRTAPGGWQWKQSSVRVLNDFPTADGTGVSAGGRRT